jgi:hypothetical protein
MMHFRVPTTATITVLLALASSACEKSSSTDIAPPKDPPAPSASAQAVGTATVAPTPSAVATEAPSASAAVASATAAVAKADAGKAKDGTPAAQPSGAVALKAASKHVTGKNFTLDLATPGCKAASECAMTIKLVASGDFHVNKEYPYKFVAAASPSVAFLGKGEATTFTRATGDFVEQGEKAGTMTVRFKPSAAGDTTVAGTYKFSVCNADQCQIEQEKLELAVPVL